MHLRDADLARDRLGRRAVVAGEHPTPTVPHLEQKNGVLYLNPGSAGPRRFTLPVTLARIKVQDNSLHPELLELKV